MSGWSRQACSRSRACRPPGVEVARLKPRIAERKPRGSFAHQRRRPGAVGPDHVRFQAESPSPSPPAGRAGVGGAAHRKPLSSSSLPPVGEGRGGGAPHRQPLSSSSLPPVGEGRGGGGGAANHLQDLVPFLEHLIIPESQHPKALRVQPYRPPCILLYRLRMLTTVSSTTNRCSKQTKSTMYGPIGACLRNRQWASCRCRRWDHNKRSASVMFFRRSRALVRLIALSPGPPPHERGRRSRALGWLDCVPPPRPSPRAHEREGGRGGGTGGWRCVAPPPRPSPTGGGREETSAMWRSVLAVARRNGP